MKESKFKTNIKCGACETAVRPYLNKIENSTWEIDLKHPDRVLTVRGEVDNQLIIEALEQAGYSAQPI